MRSLTVIFFFVPAALFAGFLSYFDVALALASMLAALLIALPVFFGVKTGLVAFVLAWKFLGILFSFLFLFILLRCCRRLFYRFLLCKFARPVFAQLLQASLL